MPAVSVLRRLGRTVRRSPVTAGYVALLLATHPWADRLGPVVSTNLHNLGADPVGALAGSALVFDGTLTPSFSLGFAGTLITLGGGVILALAYLERRYGAGRAFGVFAAGHVGATLLTAGVIETALARGWYPPEIRHASDFGISYGAQAAMAAAALRLRHRAWRLPALAAVFAWPLGGAGWSGPLPDFTTVGHLLAAAIGVAAAPLLRDRQPPPAEEPAAPEPAAQRS